MESSNPSFILPKSTAFNTKRHTINRQSSNSASNRNIENLNESEHENEVYLQSQLPTQNLSRRDESEYNESRNNVEEVKEVEVDINRNNERKSSVVKVEVKASSMKQLYKVNLKTSNDRLTMIKDPFVFAENPENEDDEANKKKKLNKCLISVYITGGESAEKTLKIASQELFKSPSLFSFLGIYVYDEENKSAYNYANCKETVLENFSTRLLNIENEKNFIMDMKITETGFEEALYLATGNKSAFFTIGYDSLKGPFGKNSDQLLNSKCLLSKAKIPVIVMKEFKLRKELKKKGYNWFILLDHSYINCFKAFTVFSELIDKENDFVYAFGSYPSYITFDVYQKQFTEFCEEKGIRNYSYESDSYVKKVSNVVFEKINYGSTHFDFMVFYNNIDRFHKDGDNAESLKIMTKTAANLCFINNIY